MTRDYKRQGSTTLFAAMNIATGEVLTDYKPRHRNQEWLAFLKLVDAIELWTQHWNDNPKPFIWHNPAEEIIAKVKRGRAALNQVVESATDH
jgi:hypothetical protein